MNFREYRADSKGSIFMDTASKISNKEIGLYSGIESNMIDYKLKIKGTIRILNKLTIAVKVTERATSPSANFVRTFEVTPPGAAAITITPKAISGDSEKILINIKAIIGSKIT